MEINATISRKIIRHSMFSVRCWVFDVSKFLVLFLLLTNLRIAAAPAYPLRLSPGNHYVVDTNNVPFFIQGDSAWLLAKYLTASNQDWYLSNRWAQGFNAIIIDMHPFYSGGGVEVAGETADAYGNLPFTNTTVGGFTNLLSINPNYLTNVDHVISKAAEYGMVVFMYPMYDGYPNSGEGWWDQMVGNGSNTLFQYGQWVGNHYKNTPNLVYIGAGDFNEPNPPNTLWSAVAHGILSVDTNHLFTAQADDAPWGQYSARQWYSNDWCNLNSSYPRSASPGPYITYNFAITNYAANPVVPSFSREPYYEFTPYSPANTDYDCRRYAWGSVTYGEAGHFYGNAHIATYNFDAGWQTQIFSAGALSMTNVIRLMRTRPWWNCIPDTNHTTISSGAGIYGAVKYITCMREATGKTVIAYIPNGTMQPSVNLARISGASANAWWYDPRSGAATAIGNFTTIGTQKFTPPDTNDWVLVLDDATLNLPPPGVVATPPVTLAINRLGNQQFQLIVAGTPGQPFTLASTTNLNSIWQPLTTGTADVSGTFLFNVTETVPATFYRLNTN